MATKKCIACGREFEGTNDTLKCPECVVEVKKTSLAPRMCSSCGIQFIGGPRAKYCPNCRADRQRQQSNEYKARKKVGKVRQIGSTDICEVCGKEYTVMSGLQRYCSECAEAAVREKDRSSSITWNAEHDYYDRRREGRAMARIQIPCIVCGKLFSQTSCSKCCSPECRAKRKEN